MPPTDAGANGDCMPMVDTALECIIPPTRAGESHDMPPEKAGALIMPTAARVEAIDVVCERNGAKFGADVPKSDTPMGAELIVLNDETGVMIPLIPPACDRGEPCTPPRAEEDDDGRPLNGRSSTGESSEAGSPEASPRAACREGSGSSLGRGL